jgi:hypothetical protein
MVGKSANPSGKRKYQRRNIDVNRICKRDGEFGRLGGYRYGRWPERKQRFDTAGAGCCGSGADGFTAGHIHAIGFYGYNNDYPYTSRRSGGSRRRERVLHQCVRITEEHDSVLERACLEFYRRGSLEADPGRQRQRCSVDLRAGFECSICRKERQRLPVDGKRTFDGDVEPSQTAHSSSGEDLPKKLRPLRIRLPHAGPLRTSAIGNIESPRGDTRVNLFV